jgi:diphthamide synthase (EF-2-diphthine--ammonia ligase)
MKIGCLLSGGKDSLYAAYIAEQSHDVVCAITISAENIESYMFHTPNIILTQLQSEAMGLPHVMVTSQGNKEEELVKKAAARAEGNNRRTVMAKDL